MFFKLLVLKNFPNLSESTCVGVLFNKVGGCQNCNFIKKRLQRRCFLDKCPKFLRKLFFTDHLQWLLLTVSGFQSATLLKKMVIDPAKMFFCEFCKFLRTSFGRTTGWLLLVFICEFGDVFRNTSFKEHLWKTAYFMYKLQDLNE